MSLTAATKEQAALAIANATWGDRVSLHTGDPGTTGANEAAGGSYTRMQTTWAGGSDDGVVPGSEVTIDANAGAYSHFGVWSAGGTFRHGGALPGTVTLGAAGQIKVTPTVTVP
jgi:hypothetical protein